MTLTLDSSHSNHNFGDFSTYLQEPGTVEAPVASRRHRVSCGSLTASVTSNEDTSGTRIIRSCSSSFSHAPEYQKPVGRYHHLHQQHSNHWDTSVLASTVRVAATIGLSVSGEQPGGDITQKMSSANSADLPYILRSVR